MEKRASSRDSRAVEDRAGEGGKECTYVYKRWRYVNPKLFVCSSETADTPSNFHQPVVKSLNDESWFLSAGAWLLAICKSMDGSWKAYGVL